MGLSGEFVHPGAQVGWVEVAVELGFQLALDLGAGFGESRE